MLAPRLDLRWDRMLVRQSDLTENTNHKIDSRFVCTDNKIHKHINVYIYWNECKNCTSIHAKTETQHTKRNIPDVGSTVGSLVGSLLGSEVGSMVGSPAWKNLLCVFVRICRKLQIINLLDLWLDQLCKYSSLFADIYIGFSEKLNSLARLSDLKDNDVQTYKFMKYIDLHIRKNRNVAYKGETYHMSGQSLDLSMGHW